MSDLTTRAEAFARQAHAGQTRKGAAAEPYDRHLAEVAGFVARHGGDEIAQAIGNRASQLDLRDLAMAAGMTTIPQDARRRCAEGITSPEEIFRVAAYL